MSYVYFIKWSFSGVWYYGRRTAHNCCPGELWVTYFTSSKYVKEYVKKHGNPDIIQVRKIFKDHKKCELYETRFLNKTKAVLNANSLNRSNATSKMSSKNMAPAKEAMTGISIGLILLSDPRWQNGEIVGINKGVKNIKTSLNKKNTIPAKDCNGKDLGNIHKNDPRWKTGEIFPRMKGTTQSESSKEKNKISNQNKISVITPEGQKIKVKSDHPLYLNGIYKGVSQGMIWVTNGLISKTVKKEMLSEYLLNGWTKGRIIRK